MSAGTFPYFLGQRLASKVPGLASICQSIYFLSALAYNLLIPIARFAARAKRYFSNLRRLDANFSQQGPENK
jgi:hypothetical protein